VESASALLGGSRGSLPGPATPPRPSDRYKGHDRNFRIDVPGSDGQRRAPQRVVFGGSQMLRFRLEGTAAARARERALWRVAPTKRDKRPCVYATTRPRPPKEGSSPARRRGPGRSQDDCPFGNQCTTRQPGTRKLFARGDLVS
jgi:hypothetical protein